MEFSDTEYKQQASVSCSVYPPASCLSRREKSGVRSLPQLQADAHFEGLSWRQLPHRHDCQLQPIQVRVSGA